jgi:hypothetical protein
MSEEVVEKRRGGGKKGQVYRKAEAISTSGVRMVWKHRQRQCIPQMARRSMQIQSTKCTRNRIKEHLNVPTKNSFKLNACRY